MGLIIQTPMAVEKLTITEKKNFTACLSESIILSTAINYVRLILVKTAHFCSYLDRDLHLQLTVGFELL